MIPGFRRNRDRRVEFGRRQVFLSTREGGMIMNQQRNDELVRRVRPASAPMTRSAPRPERTVLPGSRSARPGMTTKPAWLKYDRVVLRFYGYFLEDVDDVQGETQRVRRIIMYYYVAESKIHIAEPKVQNSGMPQGVLVKKCKVTRPDGEVYKPKDFALGREVHVHARSFVLTDADPATRAFYKRELGGIDLGPPAEVPPDRRAVKPARRKVQSLANRRAPDTLRRFMKHDKQVLSFSAFWDDTSRLYGEKRKFVVNYYLAKNQMEVREVQQPNSGRDPYPLLLAAQTVKKRDGSVVKDTDLRTGGSVEIFGRTVILVDCDRFTRDYYRNTYGVDQEARPELMTGPKEPPASVPEPPHTGFGDPQDALQSHYSLNPKPIKKNTRKLQRLDRKVLRFRARLTGGDVSDKMRRFVVQYFLADDTLLIFEPPIRNSGIVGGKLIERGNFRHMAPPEGGPPRPFRASDFFAGAVIPNEFAPQQRFELLEADAFTLKYCEGNPQQFPYSNVELVCTKLADHLVRGKDSVNLRQSLGGGTLSKEALCERLHAIGLLAILEQQELITIVRRYDEAGSGAVLVDELCDDVSRAAASAGLAADGGDSLQAKLQAQGTCLRKVFRRIDKNGDGMLSRDEWYELLDLYQIQMSEDDAMDLFDQYDSSGDGQIAYNEFCDAIYPCEFGGTEAGGGADAGGPSVEATFAQHFSGKKWALRKAFRARDADASGQLGENDFMDAITTVAPSLSDDDCFAFANFFFPSPSATVEWNAVLALV